MIPALSNSEFVHYLYSLQEWMTWQEETTHNEMRDTKDIWSRLLRASSHYPLLAYCQSDHKQLGVTWAGNKLLINNYLNGGKHTGWNLLCLHIFPLHFCYNSEYFVKHVQYKCCIYIKVYVSTVSDVTCITHLYKCTVLFLRCCIACLPCS